MAFVINDYFVPGYLEDALRKVGKLNVTATSPPGDGIVVRHLQVDRDVLNLAGRELRSRRHELLGGGDRVGWEDVSGRLSGLNALVTDICRGGSALREEALKVLPRTSGFSSEMVRILLDSFTGLMPEKAWYDTNGALPPNQAALEFVKMSSGYAKYYSGPLRVSLPKLLATSRRHRARPVLPLPVTGIPRLVANIAAGNAPGIAIVEALLALFVGAASLGKNASAEPYFGSRLLAELAVLESRRGLFPLSDLVTLVTFQGTEQPLLEELVQQADHLQVTGGLDSQRDISRLVRRLRPRSPRDLKRRVSGHWHKVSFDVIANEYLRPEWGDTVAFNVAFDNSMFNTQGCLSAQQVFVEGREGEVLQFAERFVEHMRAILRGLPKGARPHDRLREMYEWYENRGGVTILTALRDMQTYPFFVACESETKEFAVYNALNRSILIRRVDRLETDLPRLLGIGEKRDLLQSCGVAVPQERLLGLAEILGRAGVNRIVAAGNIWNMRLGAESWDGYMPPTDLIAPQLGYWTTISFDDLDRELLRVEARNKALL
jgi:hypothetical protein